MKNVKNKLFLLIIIFITLFLNSNIVLASPPTLQSNAAILIDYESEIILYGKNENKRMYPASTTKIVTAILTLENSNLDNKVIASYDAVMSIPAGYSSANIQIGEELTVEQLLQVLLVHSANDAANILAEYIGGSIDSFVSMMNTKIHELGLVNTNFTNTYGKHDDNHYTTAYDLAMIMKYCMKNEDFRRIAGSASCAIPTTNKYGTRLYTSTNSLIIPNDRNYYKHLTAGKTGFTTQAGDCLVSCSYKDNLELICVILDGKVVNNVSTRFSETRTLYEYGYLNYSLETLVHKSDVIQNIQIDNATNETTSLNLLAESSLETIVKNYENNIYSPEITLNTNILAPISEGDILRYC